MPVTSIRLQTELEEPLDELATKLRRSKNWIINQAIKDYLSAQMSEDKYWQDTLQALESVNKGKVIDNDDVHKWLESWGADNELDAPKITALNVQDMSAEHQLDARIKASQLQAAGNEVVDASADCFQQKRDMIQDQYSRKT